MAEVKATKHKLYYQEMCNEIKAKPEWEDGKKNGFTKKRSITNSWQSNSNYKTCIEGWPDPNTVNH